MLWLLVLGGEALVLEDGVTVRLGGLVGGFEGGGGWGGGGGVVGGFNMGFMIYS